MLLKISLRRYRTITYYLWTLVLFTFLFLLVIIHFATDSSPFSHQSSSTYDCKTDLLRGHHQNVIGYSLYGNWSDPEHYARYIAPMKLVLQQISQFYPGWIIRIYTPLEDLKISQRLLEFFKVYEQVDVCNVTSVLETLNIEKEFLFPMTWRFLPLLDPSVDRFMSRDTDSKVLKREADAVNEWLQSPFTFHVMRDHEQHCVPMLGGMWGVKIHQNRSSIHHAAQRLFHFYLRPDEMEKGDDQIMLNKFIWPLAVNSLMAHDSYCCMDFPESTKPFPTQREGTAYVGDVIYLNVESDLSSAGVLAACKKECRPKNHPDWTYC